MSSGWRRGRGARARVAVLALPTMLLIASACSNDNGDTKDCKARAAFDLSVRTATGPLPEDTEIEVEYGGTLSETYRLSDPVHAGETVLCQATGPDAGTVDADTEAGSDAGSDAGPTEVLALRCALWTSGLVTISVRASGYPDLKRELTPTAEHKCIQTVPVELVLGATDASD